MDFIQALILGFVQGMTEFIPVSSSAHLVLVPWAMGWASPGLAFDTILHWGTLLAVLGYFWGDWVRLIGGFIRSLVRRGPWSVTAGGRLADPDARLAWWLILGSIPAAVLGYFFNDFFESLFGNPAAVGGFLLVTALILAISEMLGRRIHDLSSVNLLDALLIGLAQAIAIAPGISRSGATIAAGLGRGLKRDDAARFSFLLGTPAILGAGLLQLVDMIHEGSLLIQLPFLAVGFLAAAISGYLCIKFLLAYLRRGRLYVFAAYCALIGGAVLLAGMLR
jgi:undecaprenyl-diphosphatase